MTRTKNVWTYRVLLASALATIPTTPAAALELTADSGSSADLQAAVDQVKAAGGGTVRIPDGDFPLTDDVKMPDGVSLIGAGEGVTILRGGGAVVVDPRFYGRLDRFFRISGISFLDAGAKAITIHHATAGFRVDHCTVEISGGAGIAVKQSSRGLIDNCTINIDGSYYGITVTGTDTWAASVDGLLGSEDAIFVEDCVITGTDGYHHAIVGHGAAHYVFRYNTLSRSKGHHVDAHGPGYGPDHGTRCVEVYRNTIEGYADAPPQKAMGIRGGGGVIFENTVEDFQNAVALVLESGSDTASYPVADQVHELWIWGNNLVDTASEVTVISMGGVDGGTATAREFIQEDRDFFLSAKAGYVPHAYPHPYRGEAAGDAGPDAALDAGADAGPVARDAAQVDASPPDAGNPVDPDEGCSCATSAGVGGLAKLWPLLALGALLAPWGGRRRKPGRDR
jgi:MYXO-CTERM domain-containing protein